MDSSRGLRKGKSLPKRELLVLVLLPEEELLLEDDGGALGGREGSELPEGV